MHAGTIELIDGRIRYTLDGSVAWDLPLSDVRVLGESTNDHGPVLDDYFLCFATGPDQWYEASFYAEGRDPFLRSLAEVLEYKFEMKLIGSTDYDSNVLWPAHLAERKMFRYQPTEPTTWIGRLVGSWSNTQWLSDEVLGELQQQDRASRAE